MSTTVFTRLYPTARTAERVAKRLFFRKFPRSVVTQVAPKEGESIDDLAKRLTWARVPDMAAKAYANKMNGENTLLVIRANYRPLGARRIAREILAQSQPMDVGISPTEFEVPDEPPRATSILADHPLFLSLPNEREEIPLDRIADIGLPLISGRNRRANSAWSGTRRMSWFWPMPLLTKNRTAKSAWSGTRHMSRAFWPMPLLKTNPRSNSVIRGGKLILTTQIAT